VFKNLLLYLFIFCILINYNNAQNNNLKNYGKGLGQVITKPLNWDKNDVLRFGLISATTVSLMFLDESIKDNLQNNNQYSKSILIETGRIYGEPYTAGTVALILALQGWINSNDKNLDLAFQVFQSYSYTLVTTGLLKFTLGRARPRNDLTAFHFEPFTYFDDNKLSLPSGHTSLAFSLSTILALNNSDNKYNWLYYIPAVVTAFSRMYQNHHWLSDVFLGACLGYFIARFTYEFNQEQKLYPNQTPPSFNIQIAL